MTETESKPTTRTHDMGTWMTGGLGAANFACILAIIGKKLEGPHAIAALRLFAAAVPLLLVRNVVAKDSEGLRKSLGWIAKALPVVGLFLAVVGMGTLLWAFDPTASAIFVALSLISGNAIVSADKRRVRGNTHA